MYRGALQFLGVQRRRLFSTSHADVFAASGVRLSAPTWERGGGSETTTGTSTTADHPTAKGEPQKESGPTPPPKAPHTIIRAAAAREAVPDLNDDRLGGVHRVVGGATGSYILHSTADTQGGISSSGTRSSSSNGVQVGAHTVRDGLPDGDSTLPATEEEGFAGGGRMSASVLSPVKPGLLSDDFELYQLVQKKTQEAAHAPPPSPERDHHPARFEKLPDSEADLEQEAAAAEAAQQNPLSPADAFYKNLSEDSELDMIKRLRDARAPFGERLRSTVDRWMSVADGRGQHEAIALLRIHAGTVSVGTTTQNLRTVVESCIPFILRQPLSSQLLRHAAAIASDVHAEALKPHLSFALIHARETEMPASEGLFSEQLVGKPLACYACVSAQVVDDEFLCVTTKVHYGAKSGLCLLWRTTLYKAELRDGGGDF